MRTLNGVYQINFNEFKHFECALTQSTHVNGESNVNE